MYLQQTPLDCEYHQNEMRTTCANPEEFPYYYFENLRNLNFPKGGGGLDPTPFQIRTRKIFQNGRTIIHHRQIKICADNAHHTQLYIVNNFRIFS